MGLPDAAYLGEDLLAPLGELSALPNWVGSLTDEATWRLATMHALLVRSDLAFISLWSPTFLLVLLDRLSEAYPELDELLLRGGVLEGHPISPDPAAWARLHAYQSHGEAKALWPRLRLISAWADGSSAPFAKALQKRLPRATFEPKGLLSTEGVISTPRAGGAPVLAAGSGFFEFLDEHGATRFAHELEEGNRYEVVLTTASGLYRYRTGDEISCQGFLGETPRLRFLGRLGLSSDLVGEKLNEAFVARCLEGVEGFRMLVPSLSSAARYCLVVDRSTFRPDPAMLLGLDQRLKANPQYAHARHMGQLAELELLPVSDPLGRFLAHSVREGRRPGDLKVPALRPEPFWEMIFRQESP